MTLIQSVELGGIMVAMTSDTRQVLALSLGGKTKYFPIKDSPGKIERISPYCIFGGGGSNDLVNVIKKRLLERSYGALFVDDFKTPLEDVISELREERTYHDSMNDETRAQLTITGFNEDGSTAVLSYHTGAEVEYKRHEFLAEDMQVIAPSADEVKAIISSVKFPQVTDINEFPNASISFLASIQGAAFALDSETVSETCNYCVIFRNPATFEFNVFEGSLKVNE